jgi:hypothetical protein
MKPIDIRSPRVRWVLLFVATVALVAMIDTCKSVTDNVLTGRQGATEAANCVSDCAHSANEAIREESDLHVANVHACAGNSGCLTNENSRHQAAVAAIQDQRKNCQESCKHQGGGSGGR